MKNVCYNIYTKRKFLVRMKIGGIKNESKTIFGDAFDGLFGGFDLVFFRGV